MRFLKNEFMHGVDFTIAILHCSFYTWKHINKLFLKKKISDKILQF